MPTEPFVATGLVVVTGTEVTTEIVAWEERGLPIALHVAVRAKNTRGDDITLVLPLIDGAPLFGKKLRYRLEEVVDV